MFFYDRNSYEYGFGTQSGSDLFHHPAVVGSNRIHFVDEGYPRYPILVGLSPYGFGLGFNPSLAAENDYRTVEDSEAPLDLGRKVHMAGGIDNINVHALPVTTGSGGGYRNTPFPFIRKVVHDALAIMSFSNLVGSAGKIKDTFGSGCFAGIDMGDYPYVPHLATSPFNNLKKAPKSLCYTLGEMLSNETGGKCK